MKILVTYDGEELFEGDCEDFLEVNEYDEELEEFLNILNNCKIGTIKKFYGNQGMVYCFEKLEDDDIWE